LRVDHADHLADRVDVRGFQKTAAHRSPARQRKLCDDAARDTPTSVGLDRRGAWREPNEASFTHERAAVNVDDVSIAVARECARTRGDP
jgi:hypothetical protein